MDYAAHYARLIDRARLRVLVGYSERHHIIPRCLNGDDAAGNIVRLTAEEHYVAHKLLVRINPGHVGLMWAAVAMTNATLNQMRTGNKLYGWLRREFSQAMRQAHLGVTASAETRERQAAAKRGKKRAPHSAETRAKMSAASTGRPKSAAHIRASALARTGLLLGPRQNPVTACRKGHVFDAANTRRAANGSRICRTCHRNRARGYYHRPEASGKD